MLCKFSVNATVLAFYLLGLKALQNPTAKKNAITFASSGVLWSFLSTIEWRAFATEPNGERAQLLDGSQSVDEAPKINLNMLAFKRFSYSLPTITMLALGGYLYDGKAMPKIIQSCEKNFDWSRAAAENAALVVKVVALLSLWTLKCGMMHWQEPLYRIVQWSKLPGEWSGNSMKVELMMAWGINSIFCLCNTLLQLNDVAAETALPVTMVSCTFLFWSLEVGGIPKAAVNCFDRCSPRAIP